MKYSLSQREIPREKPQGFPNGSGYISLYIPTPVTIQIFSIKLKQCPFWRSILKELILHIAPTAGQNGKILPHILSNTGELISILSCLVIRNVVKKKLSDV